MFDTQKGIKIENYKIIICVISGNKYVRNVERRPIYSMEMENVLPCFFVKSWTNSFFKTFRHLEKEKKMFGLIRITKKKHYGREKSDLLSVLRIWAELSDVKTRGVRHVDDECVWQNYEFVAGKGKKRKEIKRVITEASYP